MPPWPTITGPFRQLEKKLKEFGPKEQLGIIDYWIGRLFDIRSRIQAGEYPGRKRG